MIALLKEGDTIVVDIDKQLLEVKLSEEEIAQRKKKLDSTCNQIQIGSAGKIRQTGLIRVQRRGHRLSVTRKTALKTPY